MLKPITLQQHPPETASSAAPSGSWLSVLTHLDPRYGGLSAVVPQLSNAVASEGQLSMSLAAFCAPGELYSPANFAHLTLTEWPAGRAAWWRDRSLLPEFRRLVSEKDGVHLHGLWEQSTSMAARAARDAGIPYVVSAHGMLEPWALQNKRLKKRIYAALVEKTNLAGAACLHALTHAEAADYRSFGCKNPIAIIPNGVRIPESASPDRFFTHYPALKGKRIILFLGRIHFKKGLDLLVQSWKKIVSQWPEAHLVLAGPDFEGTKARVMALVEQEQLGASVLFPGMLRDEMKWSALAAAEGFVLPSYSEGLSVSVLEAMGLGLPVIITDHCNLPEVSALEAGWVIPATQPALERALTAMLENRPETNRETGSRGRRFVREQYNWSTVAGQMTQVYSWLQGGSSPSSVEVLTSSDGPA